MKFTNFAALCPPSLPPVATIALAGGGRSPGRRRCDWRVRARVENEIFALFAGRVKHKQCWGHSRHGRCHKHHAALTGAGWRGHLPACRWCNKLHLMGARNLAQSHRLAAELTTFSIMYSIARDGMSEMDGEAQRRERLHLV